MVELIHESVAAASVAASLEAAGEGEAEEASAVVDPEGGSSIDVSGAAPRHTSRATQAALCATCCRAPGSL